MCLFKCMLNVYKNQQNRQTGSRNLMGPKMLSTVTEKNVTKNILDGRKDGRTEIKQYTPSPFGERGYKNSGIFVKMLV